MGPGAEEEVVFFEADCADDGTAAAAAVVVDDNDDDGEPKTSRSPAEIAAVVVGLEAAEALLFDTKPSKSSEPAPVVVVTVAAVAEIIRDVVVEAVEVPVVAAGTDAAFVC